MKLKKLIEKLEHKSYGFKDVEVTGISCDSRSVEKGNLFAALKGEHTDGGEFAKEAVEKGASSVLAGSRIKGIDVPQVIVDDMDKALAKTAVSFYREPSKGLKVVGITGTNGKTTAAYLIESILKEAGLSAGVVSTVNYRFGGKTLRAPFTTPQAPHLQRILREMTDSGVTHCVMEVSSHSLTQRRVDGCAFSVRVFMNLSPEHLDYHHTMGEYFEAKARLFTDTALQSNGSTSIINVDDEWGEALGHRLEGVLNYSITGDKRRSEIYPLDFSLSAEGIEAAIVTPGGTVKVSSALVGEYNLYNIMAAVGAAYALGIEAPVISRGVNALKTVPGRLEMVAGPGLSKGREQFNAFVDYAHTPDALERVLGALKGIAKGRIITVFGCGGNRDRGKRPLMGEVSARLSDITIVTSDNPRDEDPLDIISEIEGGMEGVKKYGPNEDIEDITDRGYTVIPEREEAIARAVSFARKGDTVLVAGKGHEDYQIVKGERRPFDDRMVLKVMTGSVCSINGSC